MEIPKNESSDKKVKVRVNVSGKRYVGYVNVSYPITRVSDVLNNEDRFITLFEVDSVDPISGGAHFVINKKHIVFVQALEEFEKSHKGVHEGRFIGVKIQTVDSPVEGEIFQPGHLVNRPFSTLLGFHSYFLNVRDVTIPGKNELYGFLAVGINQIRSVEFIPERKMEGSESFR